MIPVLLIGLGRIASLLEKDSLRNRPCTHAGTIFSPWGKKKFFLVGAIDPSEDRRSRFCKDWNIPKILCFPDFKNWASSFYSSQSEKDNVNSTDLRWKKKGRNFPHSNSIDPASCLVVIATPSETHYELAKAAIDFGFRRLLVEKPVCHSLSLARKLSKLCCKTGTDLRVNHERRYHPLYIQVRKWIQEETYGPVRTIRASVLTSARNPGRAILDKTGPLFHDGTHAVDLLTWYLGMPDRVVSVLRSYPNSPVEEQALALMTYPKGETVFLEAGGMRNYFQFELDIQTENARFLVGNDEVRFWKSEPSRKYKGFKSLTPISISEKSSAGSNPFLNLYDSLFRHLSGKSSRITGDMEENLQILTLLDTIRRRAEKRFLGV
ncbi:MULTISPECIES: Gfo/Idh/MocA family protein [Leptospira]|uniref:Oxidoreductase, NAD-binding domain protein n=4 Tax=Leptospira weilii TaxID=28184 RepID=A0A828YZN3_9LEPT|nr:MULTISPECIES: Gfo/Idh/MocA family oxidoreductase [Leptospira]EMM72483.1 oxidoreductase, NAD-binding domain protein [Leptospira weilii str. 2006001855]EKR63217.1 oxidoreductase, NAD-binding domain protein [Leptospira weilii str. 2006001853]EMJ66024.1 oxidoreductase, NAD-binding domain protein [Leptospira sp. P2653]EMN43459.1 oxidoreductase, NAD-binding domain protein [Leptospira weilii str. LNT 1234]EMN91082.1 oxidoreductase, NAD-binding domain protein [Leptospira weilii str. UI 13098]